MLAHQAATVADPLLFVDQIGARTGHSATSVRQLRSRGHELYSRARRVGNRLALEESIVNSWVELHKDAVMKRLAAKANRKVRALDDSALDESLERLIGSDELMELGAGIDVVRHHSWCIDMTCRGCLAQGW